MNKRTVISVTVVAMLFAISLFFVGGTYARYASDYTGTAAANIAAWKVKVNNQEPTSKTLSLTFNTDENEFVTDGKIAPGSSISSTVPIDLTGTEVAVDVKVDVDASSIIAEKFGDSADKVTASVEVDGENVTKNSDGTTTISLDGVSTPRNVKITITWENDESKNVSDTTVGSGADLSLEIPVTITLQQHLSTDAHSA